MIDFHQIEKVRDSMSSSYFAESLLQPESISMLILLMDRNTPSSISAMG